MLGNYKVIGICACEVHSEYPKDIILSICKQLESSDFADYRVILFNSYNSLFTDDDDIKGEASVFNLAEPSIIDVMIILPESIQNKTVTEDIICRMRASNVPVICIDSIFDGCINVVFEYESAFEKIVRHVIKDHGCRTVNFLAGVKGNEASDIREKCFRRVLMENDIKLESGRLDYGGFWDVPTIDAMDRFMASGLSMPDAIICANDAMAISVCRYLKKLGIRVPDDVIVTGFDGIELEKYNTPRLTTAKIDIEYLGNFIEKTVSSLISGQTVDEFLTIPYKSQISQSCRCVPINLSVTNEKIIEVHNMAKRSSYHEDHMFRYIAKATVCNDFDELADVMTGYSDYNFWCCINRDFIVHDPYCKRYGQYFTEDMIQLVRKSGERAEKNITFKAKELLYDLESVFGEFHAIMLCPINFHSAIYGYIAAEIHQYHPFENTRRFLFNTNMILENFRQRKLLSIANAELDLMQMTDSMTGLYNRRGFYRNVRSLFDKKNPSASVIVFSVDMDNLKYINDSFGHKEGDKAILAVSEALKSSTDNNAVTARFGGDEFALVTLSDDPESYISDFISKLESILCDFNRSAGAPYEIHASIGYSVMNSGTYQDINEHFKIADKEMYSNKMKYKAQYKK